MNVKEIKHLAPLVDVYELKKDCRYLIIYDEDRHSTAQMMSLANAVGNAILIGSHDPHSIRLLELPQKGDPPGTL